MTIFSKQLSCMFYFFPHFCTILCQQIRWVWRNSTILDATGSSIFLCLFFFWRMLFTESCFPKNGSRAISRWCANISYLLHFHIQASLLGACDMECSVAARLVALDAGTNATAFTNAARQLPTCCCNSVNAVNGFQKYTVCKADFWYPQCTNNVCPITVVSLLKGATPTRTKAARDCTWRRVQTSSTNPRTIWYVWYSVALLVDCQVTEITKKNNIVAVAFTIKTYTTDSILISQNMSFTDLTLKVWLLFKIIHQQLEHLFTNWRYIIFASSFIDYFQPCWILQKTEFNSTHATICLIEHMIDDGSNKFKWCKTQSWTKWPFNNQ